MTLMRDLTRVYGLLEPWQRRWFFAVLGMMVLAALLQVASVASVYPFLSVVANPGVVREGWFAAVYTGLGFPSVERFLAALALVVFFLVVFSNGVVLVEKWTQARFEYGVNHSVSCRLLGTYLHKDYAFFLGRNSSELQKNVVSETNRISKQLIHAALKLLSGLLVTLGMVALLFVAHPVATLIVMVVIGGGYAAMYRVLSPRLKRMGKQYVKQNRLRHKIALESFSGVKDVKLMGREQALLDRYRPVSRSWSRGLAKYAALKELPKFMIETLAVGGLLLVLAVLLVTGQPVAAIIPMMGLFVFAGYRLMPVFKEMMSALAAFRFNEALMDVIVADLESDPTGATGATGASASGAPSTGGAGGGPLAFRGEIRLEGVTFRYPGAVQPVLRGVDVTIPKNRAVAFVGETGAGKTTLVDVILGLYPPQEGSLKVDGVPVTRENVRAWQRNIGYVPQEIYLTDDSVKNNIAFLLPAAEVDDAAVEQAARVAHIHDFIVNELPQGYDTMIGERGVRLSGGQRQRIGIARALYHDPEVLVLDEATSDIDNVTEANITAAIDRLAGTKTLVIIAHRLSTIRNCDRIYMLDRGAVVGVGTYDSLVEEHQGFQALAQMTGDVAGGVGGVAGGQ